MSGQSAFSTVTVTGGLLPGGLLERVDRDDSGLEASGPTDYHLASGERIRDAITQSWNRLLPLWQRFAPNLDAPERGAQTGPTRQEWLLPLFDELGYGHLAAAPAFEVEGKRYPISHVFDSVPIHLVGVGVEIDRRAAGVAGAATASPHGLMQEFLNRSSEHLWGITTNGRRLRMLRDNASLTRVAYAEFDLAEMFDGEVFSDFALLWLTCHASRLEGPAGTQVIERWRDDASKLGVRALDALRDGVETAIETLGSAAVGHPANLALRLRLEDRTLDPQDLYRQLLRVVYRMLFLLVAESRHLLTDPNAPAAARDRYVRYYSITRIREMAETIRGGTHTDLWQQLGVVARALESEGEPVLGLLPLGGFLWNSDSTKDLNDLTIPNEAVLTAVRSLTMVKPDKQLMQRVDYANLGAEELGSIYESLLEYVPQVNPVNGEFSLIGAAGNERKTTGSYYTPTSLIEELLNSALDPVLDEAAAKPDSEQAVLALKVVDPAAGSGHFLIAAAHRIANRLARIRAGEDEPSPGQLRTALRDVIGHCIYAVDVNPMAVELAKVAMWMEAMEPGKPLTFLDHHIVTGNGIIGATPAMLAAGVPDDAFTAKPNEGDDRTACTMHKQRNATARRGQASLLAGAFRTSASDHSAEVSRISLLPDETIQELDAKARAWQAFSESDELKREWLMADAYCAAITFPRSAESRSWMITPYEALYELRDTTAAQISHDALELIQAEAARYRYLHWHLAFPDVFRRSDTPLDLDRCGWSGGFDVVVGNPPWDTLSPDRKEFFRSWLPNIASLSSDEQELAIDEALRASPTLQSSWEDHRRSLFSTARFFRRSGRYRMFAPGNLGKGDLNIYRAFVELALTSVCPDGAATQVTPSGIYAGANCAALRSELFERFQLDSLWGFDNSNGSWFPGVGLKAFAAYSARRGGSTVEFRASFGISTVEDLRSARAQSFTYPVAMIRQIDSDALLIPEISPGLDAQVMNTLIANRETFSDHNRKRKWHPYRREVDMGSDAGMFTKDPTGLPLYEGRMVDFYDHRAKAYISGSGRSSRWTAKLPFGAAGKRIAPQWYVHESDLPVRLAGSWWRYRIGFLDVANPKSDPRCLTAAVIPPNAICGHKVPTISFEQGEEWRYAIWLATANSLVLDYLARKRIALQVSFTVMNGLPFPEVDPVSETGRLMIDRVLRLTCVSPEMEQFRSEVTISGGLPPDLGTQPAIREDDRFKLRAELDAVVAKACFGLSREEFEHLIDDFSILREREERAPAANGPGYGEFRTKRLALEAFDSLPGAGWTNAG